MCAHNVVIPLVVDATLTIVSRSHGLVRAASAKPPQRSTTGLPSTYTQTAAPTSPRLVKFSAKASRTAAKRGSQTPWSCGAALMCFPPFWFSALFAFLICKNLSWTFWDDAVRVDSRDAIVRTLDMVEIHGVGYS